MPMHADASMETSFPSDSAQRDVYQSIIDNAKRSGPAGRLLFCVSTDKLSDSRGDLYVTLGLARALNATGWGVSLWPIRRLSEETPDDIDIAIVMTESFVPGLLHPTTKAIAWVRNWTEDWASLPYLDEFAEIWCSSQASADLIRGVYQGPIRVVPLAADIELFRPLPVERNTELVSTANFWGVNRTLTDELELVAEHERVTWFGTNSRYLRLKGAIEHRDAIDYFALPWVYSKWLVVVDDVIAAAARYGNQNSRLFDALACGAIVVSNTANGLAELGLDEVPVYDNADDLLRIMRELRDDPVRTSALAARLNDIVRSRHSYVARAATVAPLLASLAATSLGTATRSRLLRWSTVQRNELRTADTERSEWRIRYYDALDDHERTREQLTEELRLQRAELDEAEAQLHGMRTSRSYRLAGQLSRPFQAVRRRFGGPAQG